ncbi:hypothetical protein [Paenibacillus donghaensis]|uniref:Cellobiose phosphorylase n=1 Tax=Paenibacillus donghaensis TaxID=414771 RepID=A0A2Z2KR30_9BACL|nr:hypothetical protein [Paenibacillus donghaensis]ASA26353.1 hypothetical protein B9T62_16735 [Paenibacillus donghaensis]
MEAYYNCLSCKNKKVRILTIHGQQYEGVVMDVDRNNVYLRTEQRGTVNTSGYYPYGNPYANQILTLSLFTLLAIALI